MYCVCLTMQAYYVCTEVLCTDKNRTSDEREKSKYNSWCFFSPQWIFCLSGVPCPFLLWNALIYLVV